MELLQMKRVLSFHLLLSITMMSLRSQLEFATALGNETDQLALLAFKDSIIHDPSGVLSSWNDSLPFCQWEGVTCSKRHQKVVTLDLEAKGLLGTLSPSIGNLSFLNVINLGSNNFQGEIPKVIGNLHRLQVLNLSLNSFEGKFPVNLSNCRNLKLLNLNNNGLTGNLPAALMLNRNLQILLVASNNLTGRIPPSLGNISSLAYLVLMVNNLEGSIPYEFGQLTNLKWLQLAGNKLSGTLPSSLYNLTFITQLSVAGNQLQGSIPTNIGLSFPNVQWLSIGGNHFTGTIPVSLSNATKLLLLDFSQNEFTGTVPESIGSLQGFQYLNVGLNHLGSGKANDLDFLTSLTNCSSLQVLGLNDNDFGGVLPNSIANLSSQLKTLTLGRNQFYGSIPAGIENLVNLSKLGIERNALSGSIPYGIGKIQRLQQLELSENKITGQIPSSIGNITVMIELYLDDNDLEGNIPTTLGNCQALQVLNLSQNNLNGTIPNQILNLHYLSISLNLADNSLTGSLPLEIGNLKDLVELDISKNKLSGEIPETLGNCLTLEQLHMERNLFEGSIPQSLSTLKSLYVLDFSHNNLTGQIPTYFENFTLLQYLNISYNNLDGEVPIEGIFSNASATSIIGNNRLCGGIPAFQLPACPAQPTERHKNSISVKVVVPVVVGVTSIIFLSIFTILCLLRLKKRSVITSMKDQVSGLSYSKLFKATDGFSSTNLIGQGSCGYVYKGILDDHGKEVAVKVLNLRSKGALKSFTAECKALKNIRHRNLVKILGSCSSVDFNGNDFKALVFKFMPNGSLEQWLHPEEEQPHQLLLLNFMQRLNIAIDVAFALEYLHFYSHTPIIHCDLKPSNVLLDDDMTAHVGDFGLARLLSETADHSQNQTTSSCIKGTIGYVAPEYGMGNEASTYGDVYSYGILLLELFTGKRPTDEMFSYGLSLHEFAKTGLAEQTLQTVDPQLLRELEEYKEHENQEMQNLDVVANKSSMINKWECLTMVIKIGVMCSMEAPGERRGMRDVAKEMQAIKDYFMGSRNFKFRL